MSQITRREFAGSMVNSVLAYGLIDMLWTQNLFADSVKPVIDQWFKELYSIGEDLHGQKMKDTDFQAKMEGLFRRVDLAELAKATDLSGIKQRVDIPANGAYSASFDLSKVEGLPEELNFGRQIFCLRKDRAIVPHGHSNMCTGFIVLEGEFRGRHYDKLETAEDHYIIKPTIDDEFQPGGVSTISDHKDNIHWFRCTSETGFIFNAHFDGYASDITIPTGRLYLDPEGEKLAGGLIKAPKMSSTECHAKYG
ncbi:MAG TPA: hypothetical protein PLJ47_03990 [Candidatus Hydrogenedentes bacterium]|nr:hypothetical protein [Candidatus Hydrogenedentota bacterium]